MAASQGEHMKVLPGTLVQGHYEVLREIGCGNFSKVYEVRDTRSPIGAPHLALKIVKREYANDATFEKDMLKILGTKGSEVQSQGSSTVSVMREYFVWNRYPCFVMPLRGPTLRSCKFGIERGHCSRDDVVRLAHSLLTTLKFVHFDCKMVHTDLKPENILLDQARPTGEEGTLGSSWTICDFGSASLWRTDRMDSDLISTRPYRAPEVVLGNPWSFPADTWSLGCIVYEAAVGTRLFDVHDDATHLSYMEKRLGRLPDSLVKKSKNSRKYFDPNGNLNRAVRAAQGSACRVVAAARAPRSLQEVLGDDAELFDLISSMLHYDPNARIRADDALRHPIFEALNGKEMGSRKNSTVAAEAKPSVPVKETVAAPSEPTTPEPSIVRPAPTVPARSGSVPATNAAGSHQGGAAPAMKFRATNALLAAAALDVKENYGLLVLRKQALNKAAASAASLKTLAKPSNGVPVQRSGSATSMRCGVTGAPTQSRPNYAIRVKVNPRP